MELIGAMQSETEITQKLKQKVFLASVSVRKLTGCPVNLHKTSLINFHFLKQRRPSKQCAKQLS